MIRLYSIAVFTCAVFVLAAVGHPCAAELKDAVLHDSVNRTLVLTPGPDITLSGALVKAEKQNLALSMMKQEIEKSEALFSKSLGLILPAAQASLNYTHLDHGSEVDLSGMIGAFTERTVEATPLVTQEQDSLSGSLSIRQSLINVSSWFSVKTARKRVDLVELSVQDMRRQLSLSVARAYFLALSGFHLTTLQHQLLASANEHLRIAENRFAAGSGVRLDVLRARADLEAAEQDLANAQLAFDTARDALGGLIGMDGLPMPKEVHLLESPELNDDTLIKDALTDRVDVAADSKRIDLAELQKKVAWTALLPELSVIWQGTALFTDAPDMGDPDQERWSWMLSLTVPLFNWAAYADIRHKRAEHRQLIIQKEDTELTVKREVRQAKREYVTALHNVETATRHAEVMREALRLTEQAFKAGSGSSLEVTDARKNTAASEINLITTRLHVQSALLTLFHAAGIEIASAMK